MSLHMVTGIAIISPWFAGQQRPNADEFPKSIENFPYFATPSGRIACEYRVTACPAPTIKALPARGAGGRRFTA